MKLFRTLLFFACALSLNSIFAQNLMNIHQGNGTLLQIPLESLNIIYPMEGLEEMAEQDIILSKPVSGEIEREELSEEELENSPYVVGFHEGHHHHRVIKPQV